MGTAELKIDLINRIASIKEKVKLEEIRQLLRFQSDETVYLTSEDEKSALQDAKTQISKGEFTTSEELQKEIQAWLKSNMVITC